MANNKVVITFNRDFNFGEVIQFVIEDGGIAQFFEFEWFNVVTGAFQVEVGTPTGTAGETTAINLATAWGNSLTAYTVTQSTNTITIVRSSGSFVSVVAKDDDGIPLIIPTVYDYTISTETTGNKITYADKVGNTISGDAFRQWRDVDCNEVKTNHNLNDDRIGVNETNIAANTSSISGKANLSGGNSFSGDQAVTGDVTIFSDDGIEDNDGQLTVGKSSTGRVAIGTSNNKPAIQGFGSGSGFDLLLNPNSGQVGVGYDGSSALNSSYKLQVNGDTLFQGEGLFEGALFIQAVNDGEGVQIDSSSVNTRVIINSTSSTSGSRAFAFNKNTGVDGVILQALNDNLSFKSNLVTFLSTGEVSASNFTGNWNSLGTTDFVRRTGSVNETITGNKTLSGDTTFGTSGQSNTITILGDTGEDLTITKNLDGTVTFENTNNERIIVNGIIEVTGSGSAAIVMSETGVQSRTISYDGTTDMFVFNTSIDIGGDSTASNFISDNNISLSGGSGDFISRDGSTGWTGIFESLAGDTVTVKNGIITDVS
jgi:hypothetical protein